MLQDQTLDVLRTAGMVLAAWIAVSLLAALLWVVLVYLIRALNQHLGE